MPSHFKKHISKVTSTTESTSSPSDFERTVDDEKVTNDEDPDDELIDLLEDEEQEHAPEAYHISSDRNVRTVKQHTNYQYRGEVLKDYNLWMYTALIDIRKKPKNNKSDGKRPLNPRFDFHKDHPFFKTHHQVLQSKWFVPIITQKPPVEETST